MPTAGYIAINNRYSALMKHLFPLLLLAAGLTACKHNDPDVQPTLPVHNVDKLAANYDLLANANGHWQWVKHNYPFGQWKDSASIGYGRQLLFKSDSSVVLRRTSMPAYSTIYTFATGNNQFRCDAYGRKRISFATGETQLPRDYGYRTVRPYPDAQGLPELLLLAQDGECLDSGAMEVYKWVNEQ